LGQLDVRLVQTNEAAIFKVKISAKMVYVHTFQISRNKKIEHGTSVGIMEKERRGSERIVRFDIDLPSKSDSSLVQVAHATDIGS
jgi:hypothetical protein